MEFHQQAESGERAGRIHAHMGRASGSLPCGLHTLWGHQLRLTFAGTVQVLLSKHQPIALHRPSVKLQAENDITGGRTVLLMVAFHLVTGGKEKQATTEPKSMK